MEIADIWVGIIVPIIIGPLCVFLKFLWDRYNNKIIHQKQLEFDEKFNRIKIKLSDFYWPLYIKLICIYQMNYNIPTLSDDDSESSSGSSDEEVFIKHTKKKNKRCKCYYADSNNNRKKCKNKIPLNNFSSICRKCRWKSKENIIHILNAKPTNHKSIKLDTPNEINDIAPEPEPEHQLSFGNIEDIILNIPVVTINDVSIASDEDSLTGDGIGIIRELPKLTLEIDPETIKKIKSKINDLYQKIIVLLKTNIAIAEPRTKLGSEITKFLKFAEINNIIYNTKYSIQEFGAIDNTNKLLSLIELKLFDLQKEYHNLIKTGPFI